MITLPGGIEVVVNELLPPGSAYAFPKGLTEEESRAIREAGEKAQAEGRDPVQARFEALCATGKVVRIVFSADVAEQLKQGRVP